MNNESFTIYDEEKELNAPLSIGESKVASAPYKPKEDAPVIFDMNSDPRVIEHFGEDATTLEEIELGMIPEKDIQRIKELLDPNISYDDTSVLERRIQVRHTSEQGNEYPMVGWISVYRSYPQRLQRLHKEGILNDDVFDDLNHPVLEIAYARLKEAPTGLMFDGVQAELYRIYGQALEQESKKKNFEKVLESKEMVSYNKLVPLRMIATVDTNNPGSEALLVRIGFEKKGANDIRNIRRS
jgi:hypothetical protein